MILLLINVLQTDSKHSNNLERLKHFFENGQFFLTTFEVCILLVDGRARTWTCCEISLVLRKSHVHN